MRIGGYLIMYISSSGSTRSCKAVIILTHCMSVLATLPMQMVADPDWCWCRSPPPPFVFLAFFFPPSSSSSTTLAFGACMCTVCISTSSHTSPVRQAPGSPSILDRRRVGLLCDLCLSSTFQRCLAISLFVRYAPFQCLSPALPDPASPNSPSLSLSSARPPSISLHGPPESPTRKKRKEENQGTSNNPFNFRIVPHSSFVTSSL